MFTDDTKSDPDYVPGEEDVEDDETEQASKTDSHIASHVNPEDEEKFIVFSSSLMALFQTCESCKEPTHPTRKKRGTFVTIYQVNWKLLM